MRKKGSLGAQENAVSWEERGEFVGRKNSARLSVGKVGEHQE